MVYLSSLLIALGLYFAEVSILPHFAPWSFIPFLVLPFISILSLKDRTVFPLIMAAFFGALLDTVSGGVLPIFATSFLIAVVVSKVFLTQFISYGETRASVVVTSLALISIYIFEIFNQISNLKNLTWILPLSANLILTISIIFIYQIVFKKYFDWVEKKTEERFR